jgi:hypothetical protein
LHFRNQTQAEEFARFIGDESAAQMQMPGHSAYCYVSVGMEMADRNQNRVLNSRQANQGGESIADRFQPRRKCKHPVDESAKLTVGVIGQQFRPGDGQGLSAGLAPGPG